MSFELPEGARLLCTIKIDKGKAVSTPVPEYDEIAKEVAEYIGGYVEEHGEVPEFLKPMQDLAQECAEWQARQTIKRGRESE